MKTTKIISILLLIFTLLIMQTNAVYAVDTIDSIIEDANKFIESGEGDSQIDTTMLKNTSDLLYNTLLGIGMIVAVVVGIILGIKYMIGSASEKADLKQLLMGYIISCVVIFGAFGIWKLAVTVLSSI